MKNINLAAKILMIFICFLVVFIINFFIHNDKKVYIDDILTQEEISETERSVTGYVKNITYAIDVRIIDREYVESSNEYKLIIRVSGYKLYEAIIDLTKKNSEGKYSFFEVVEVN